MKTRFKKRSSSIGPSHLHLWLVCHFPHTTSSFQTWCNGGLLFWTTHSIGNKVCLFVCLFVCSGTFVQGWHGILLDDDGVVYSVEIREPSRFNGDQGPPTAAAAAADTGTAAVTAVVSAVA